MSLWSRLFGRREEKASSVGPMVYAITLGRPAFPQRDAAMLAREGYQRNVVASACIRRVAQSVAELVADADLYRRVAGGEEQEVEADPVLDLLRLPNPDQDGQGFFVDLLTNYLISGNAYAERVDGIGGVPLELWNLRTDRVKVVPGPDGRAAAYTYSAAGQVRTLPRYEGRIQRVLHLRTPNPLDDWYGMSPLDPAGFSVDVHTDSGALIKALLDNSARPSGAFIYSEGNLPQEQRESLRGELDRAYTGVKNAGRPMLLDGGMDWKQMGLAPADMQMMDVRSDMARDIARALGVPPLMLGIPGDNTFANYQEANKAFYRDTVLPLAGEVCRAVSRWLLPPDQFLKVDEDDVAALADEREKKWTAIQTADFLTVNEKREALDYEPIDGGDVLLVPASMAPLDQAGAMPPQDGVAPDPAMMADMEDDPPEDAGKAVANLLDEIVTKIGSPQITVNVPERQPAVVNVAVPEPSVTVERAQEPKRKTFRVTERDAKGYAVAAVMETEDND